MANEPVPLDERALEVVMEAELRTERYKERYTVLSKKDRDLRLLACIFGGASVACLAGLFGGWVNELVFRGVALVSGLLSASLPVLKVNDRAAAAGEFARRAGQIEVRAHLLHADIQAGAAKPATAEKALKSIIEDIERLDADDRERPNPDDIEQFMVTIERRHGLE